VVDGVEGDIIDSLVDYYIKRFLKDPYEKYEAKSVKDTLKMIEADQHAP